jgi:uncharacterized paraquat-inducible protein A
MIEIDPRWYFPAGYVLNWRCPHCGERVPIVNSVQARSDCPRCDEPLSSEPRQEYAADGRLSA